MICHILSLLSMKFNALIKTTKMLVTAQLFIDVAADEILKMNYTSRSTKFKRRWASSLKAPPEVCKELWEMLDPFNTMPGGVHPRHLLWSLHFLKVYPTNENGRAFVAWKRGAVDEKTWAKWTNIFVTAISFLEHRVVSLFE